MQNTRIFIEHNMLGHAIRFLSKNNHTLRQPRECKLRTFLSPTLRTNSGSVMKESEKIWRRKCLPNHMKSTSVEREST